MDAAIEVTGVRKRFGPVLALDGMSFTVRPGHVTGLAGPNGAGKSTTMRVILGLDAPDEGSALVGGHPYRSLRYPLNHVGSLLDAAALHPSRSARNHLLWLAHSQGLAAWRVEEVIGQAGLIAAASGNRVALRTTARPDAMTVLAHADAAVAATGRDTMTVSGLPPDRIVRLLSRSAVPFSEVSAHRATLEDACMELTRDAAEFRAATPAEVPR
jgi:ABC-type sugar transport system ATPase subunit